jgi:DNA modification methylase
MTIATAVKPFYRDKSVTLYHGNCADILPALSRQSLLLTDPPYGIGDRMQGGTWGAAAKYADFRSWDEAPEQSLLQTMIEQCDASIIWGGNYFSLPASRCWLVWRKINAVPTMAGAELAWTNIDKPVKAIDLPVGKHEHGHPTEKPIALIRWCLHMLPDAETVLDPFAGSGTTGVACKLEGRNAVLIEANERYCEIAAERLAQGVLF